MDRWGTRARWEATALCTLLCTALATALGTHRQPLFRISDSAQYLKIAQGRMTEVMQPWAARELAARLAAAIARGLHRPVESGFVVEGLVCLLVTAGVTCWLASRTGAPRWMLVAIAVVPMWVTLVQNLVYPDLLYAALLCGLFLLMLRRHFLLAAVMMFPLMLTRESTMLTLVCFLLASWSSLRWADRTVAVLATVAGSVVAGRLSVGAQPNLEHLSAPVYMLAKLPWNFLHNVLGVQPWSNVNAHMCPVPVWSMPLHFHGVEAVGVCGVAFDTQRVMLEVMLTNFGLLPLIVAVLWWRHRHRTGRSPLLRFALLYGGLSLVLSPVLGAGFLHLVGYAWPLFLIALPGLFSEFRALPAGGPRAWAALGVFGLHLAVCAVSYAERFYWPMVLTALVLWVAAGFLLRFCLRGLESRPAWGLRSPMEPGI